MRDERQRQPVRQALGPAICAGLLALSAGPARAQFLSGYAQIQYQQVEQGDQVRRLWLESYEMDHVQQFGQQLRLYSQLQFNRSRLLNGQEYTSIPHGTLRLQDAMFGLTASQLPTTTTDALGMTTHQQETSLSGYLSRQGLPRLSVSWVRRAQDDGTGGNRSSVTRSAQVTHDIGSLNLRAGYGDLDETLDGLKEPGRTQRNYTAGATYRLSLSRALPMVFQYDFIDNREGLAGSPSPNRTRQQSFGATSGSKLGQKWDWAGNYNYRRSDLYTGTLPVQRDNEGSLNLNFHPTRATRLTSMAGVRTVRTTDREDVVGYTGILAAVDGMVRPGWKGTLETAHALNNDPGEKAYWVSTYHAASRFNMARGLDLTADMLATSNRDSASVQSSSVSQAVFGVRAVPLKGILVNLDQRFYNSGPSLTAATSRSRGANLDVRWQPSNALAVEWSQASTYALPDETQRNTSTQFNFDWRPSADFQFNAHVTRNQGTGQSSDLNGQLLGSEVRGVRVLAGLSRKLRASATFSVTDPGTANHGKVLDVALTDSFGR